MIESDLLTTREAAEYLRYSAYTLRRSRLDGKLAGKLGPKFTKVGTAVRYKQGDLDEWLEEEVTSDE